MCDLPETSPMASSAGHFSLVAKQEFRRPTSKRDVEMATLMQRGRARSATLALLVAGVLIPAAAGRADDPCVTTLRIPEPIVGSAAALDPVNRYAFIFGGQTWQLKSTTNEDGSISTTAVPRMTRSIYRAQVFTTSGTSRICLTGPSALPRPLGFAAVGFVPDDANPATLFDNRAYIFGGLHCYNVGGGCGTRHSESILRYNPSAAAGHEVSEVGKLPAIPGQGSGARYAGAAAWFPAADASSPLPWENKVYVFGGIKMSDSRLTDQVVAYDPAANTSSLVTLHPEFPAPSIALSAAVYARWENTAFPGDPEDCPDGCIYLFGGIYQLASDLFVTAKVHRFDPSTGRFTAARSRLLTPRYGLSAAWVTGEEHPFDGDDPKTDTFGSGQSLCRYGCGYVFGGRGPLSRDTDAEAQEIGTCDPSSDANCAPYRSEPEEISWDETLKFDPSLNGAAGDVTTTYPVTRSVYTPGRWGTSAVWFPHLKNGYIFGGATTRIDPGASECYGQPTSCILDQIVPVIPAQVEPGLLEEILALIPGS